MVNAKKASTSSKVRSSSSKEAFGKKVKGENFYHDAKKVKKNKMMNGGKPVYGRDGKVVQAAAFQKTEAETTPGRVQPDRRWFGAYHVVHPRSCPSSIVSIYA
jgi:nuclear GTP-binding protein